MSNAETVKMRLIKCLVPQKLFWPNPKMDFFFCFVCCVGRI